MKRLVLLSLCFAFFSWIGLQIGISNTAGKPGLAGAPGDNGTCGNCHNSSPLAPSMKTSVLPSMAIHSHQALNMIIQLLMP